MTFEIIFSKGKKNNRIHLYQAIWKLEIYNKLRMPVHMNLRRDPSL